MIQGKVQKMLKFLLIKTVSSISNTLANIETTIQGIKETEKMFQDHNDSKPIY